MTDTVERIFFPEDKRSEGISLVPISSMGQKHSRALAWLRMMGVVTQNRRHEAYQEIIELAVEAHRAGGAKFGDPCGFDPTATAFVEAQQLITIYRGFRGRESDALKQKLAIVVDGVRSVQEELSGAQSNRPRNVAFELECAAPLVAAGVHVGLSQEDADLAFEIGAIRYLVECKRPLRKSGVRDAIRRGSRQLDERLKRSDQPAIGILALSLGRALVDGAPLIELEQQETIERVVEREVGRFDDEFGCAYARWRGGRKAAVALGLSFVVVIPKSPLIVVRQLPFVTLAAPYQIEFTWLADLRKTILRGATLIEASLD